MKVLIIDEDFPCPLDTGKKIRSFNLACYLALENDVSYLSYGHQSEEIRKFIADHRIKPLFIVPPDRRKHGLRFYSKLFMNLFSPYPYMVTSHYSKNYLESVRRVIQNNSFDIVICEGVSYAIFLKGIRGIKKVIAAHNIEADIWRGYEKKEKNIFKKLYITIQRIKLEKFEKKAFRWVDGATAVNEKDAEEIGKFNAGYSAEVIYNGVDLEYFQPQDIEVDKNLLVFTGSMDYMANQDAAVYFTHNIFPLIKKLRPETKAVFVGRRPPSFIKDLGKIEGITITGTVDDVRPYIAKAGVYIVPLRIGGGSRLKILEAMAMRKVIVSTSFGVAGLNIAGNESIIIRDDDQEFAEAVVNILENIELTKKQGEDGRNLVEEQYSWDMLGKKLNDYLLSLINNRENIPAASYFTSFQVGSTTIRVKLRLPVQTLSGCLIDRPRPVRFEFLMSPGRKSQAENH